MKQARKKSFFMFMMAACLVACSSEDDPVAQPQPRLLTVEVAETTIVSASAPQQAPTRTAATTTTATLTAFSMNYQESQYNFTKTGDQWSTGTWPSGVGDDVEIDFYAYNGGTLNWSDYDPYVDPYVSFDMDDNAFTQKDLLVADTTAAFSDNSGKVSLMFDHACAAVRFNVLKSVTQSVIITSVVLDGVKSKGEYHYANSAWESLSEPKTYTLTNDNITLTTTKVQLPCGYLFIIPQTKIGLTLKVNYTVDGVAKSHDFNLTGEWKVGHSYTININMGNTVI